MRLIASLPAPALLGALLGACAPIAVAPPEALPDAPRANPPVAATPERPAPETSAQAAAPRPRPAIDPELAAHYAARRDGDVAVPAIDLERIDPRFLRSRVPYETDLQPGTIIVDTAARHLFLVESGGTAMRYGIAVGREGFGWTGEGVIARKARWPRWTPPAEMIARDPALEKWRGGMPGGPQNPLGARALYIYQDGRDTLLRVHGTNEPRSVGRAASSGCFRMLNQDAIDLHARVAAGARIIVR